MKTFTEWMNEMATPRWMPDERYKDRMDRAESIQIGDKIKYAYDQGLYPRITITQIQGWEKPRYPGNPASYMVVGVDRRQKEHKVDLFSMGWEQI